jgi:uncharacterized protein YciI
MTTANGSKTLVIALRTSRFDASVIEPHRRFLEALRSHGQLELTGPFTDQSGGAYLLSAASLADAHAIVARDPLATRGASDLSVYEWSVST